MHTLTELLKTLGANIRIYDLGRRVQEIPAPQFLAFEQTELPYPLPLQRQAWFALCLGGLTREQEPLIWFINWPLDEQGKLVQGARDYFIHRLLEKPSDGEAGSSHLAQVCEDNPYRFTPREERMAIFHAKLARDLKKDKSRFFQHALDYFQGKPGWGQWSFVGYQGIADLACRVNEGRHSAILADAIPKLPQQPLRALCHCLENEPIPADLAQALFRRLEHQLKEDKPDEAEVQDLIRGMAQTTSNRIAQNMFDQVLNHRLSQSIQILAAISGRAWERLLQAETARQFLEALANNDHGQAAFNQCLADLLSLPGVKEPLLAALRNPQNSERLKQAFQAMAAEIGSVQN